MRLGSYVVPKIPKTNCFPGSKFTLAAVFCLVLPLLFFVVFVAFVLSAPLFCLFCCFCLLAPACLPFCLRACLWAGFFCFVVFCCCCRSLLLLLLLLSYRLILFFRAGLLFYRAIVSVRLVWRFCSFFLLSATCWCWSFSAAVWRVCILFPLLLIFANTSHKPDAGGMNSFGTWDGKYVDSV